MKKRIYNLGNILTKAEQKKLGGGQYYAKVACRRCIPSIYSDNCDMDLACQNLEVSAGPV